LNKLVEQFAARTPLQLVLRYNIAPTQPVAAIRQPEAASERELVLLKWGLVPPWADDPSIGSRMINARAETVAQKPSFRTAFKKRRCLILADGYYEWQKRDARKQPYLIHRRDDRPFAFAGLWEQWRGDSEEAPLESCTIITTDANDATRHVHDRMPVILDAGDYDRWLDPAIHDRSQLEPLLAPCGAEDLVAVPVSTHVNNPRNDDSRCVAPLGAT
jgi:putative SOS response-associated peptidase YedK